jgi:hypothetical protein
MSKWTRAVRAAGAARLFSPRANRLSGRHLSVHDSIDTLLGSIEEIERDDLRTLRRTATAPDTAAYGFLNGASS